MGDSSTEQLCDVLGSQLVGGDAPSSLRLVDLIDELTADPTARPAATLAIAVTYASKREAYGNLGRFRPAIGYLARAGARTAGTGVAPPSDAVRRSAEVADEAIADGTCTS